MGVLERESLNASPGRAHQFRDLVNTPPSRQHLAWDIFCEPVCYAKRAKLQISRIMKASKLLSRVISWKTRRGLEGQDVAFTCVGLLDLAKLEENGSANECRNGLLHAK